MFRVTVYDNDFYYFLYDFCKDIVAGKHYYFDLKSRMKKSDYLGKYAGVLNPISPRDRVSLLASIVRKSEFLGYELSEYDRRLFDDIRVRHSDIDREECSLLKDYFLHFAKRHRKDVYDYLVDRISITKVKQIKEYDENHEVLYITRCGAIVVQ